jgi:hypothetical protein
MGTECGPRCRCQAEPKPKLRPDRLYLGDNGRCFCGGNNGRCAGSSAYFTGRDLSGQRVHAITPREILEMRAFMGDDFRLRCEGCKREA